MGMGLSCGSTHLEGKYNTDSVTGIKMGCKIYSLVICVNHGLVGQYGATLMSSAWSATNFCKTNVSMAKDGKA